MMQEESSRVPASNTLTDLRNLVQLLGIIESNMLQKTNNLRWINLKCFMYLHKDYGLSLDRLDEVAQLAEQPVLAVLLVHEAGHDVGHHVAESWVTLRLLYVASSLKHFIFIPETVILTILPSIVPGGKIHQSSGPQLTWWGSRPRLKKIIIK